MFFLLYSLEEETKGYFKTDDDSNTLIIYHVNVIKNLLEAKECSNTNIHANSIYIRKYFFVYFILNKMTLSLFTIFNS